MMSQDSFPQKRMTSVLRKVSSIDGWMAVHRLVIKGPREISTEIESKHLETLTASDIITTSKCVIGRPSFWRRYTPICRFRFVYWVARRISCILGLVNKRKKKEEYLPSLQTVWEVLAYAVHKETKTGPGISVGQCQQQKSIRDGVHGRECMQQSSPVPLNHNHHQRCEMTEKILMCVGLENEPDYVFWH